MEIYFLTHESCFAFKPNRYNLSLPLVRINTYLFSMLILLINYHWFTFTKAHKDADDMLRPLQSSYARSNWLLRIFYRCCDKVCIELGEVVPLKCPKEYYSYILKHCSK